MEMLEKLLLTCGTAALNDDNVCLAYGNAFQSNENAEYYYENVCLCDGNVCVYDIAQLFV